MTLTQNHFELFGFPLVFDIDQTQLAERYRELQRSLHPDRFANASEQERRVSVQKAAQVNEAFQTLKAPLARARLRRVAATGWHSVMLVPMQKMTSGFSMSTRGFDMAPRPIVAARPATVGACQARLQLSM